MPAKNANPHEVFDHVREFITRYMVFPREEQADVVAMWVIHTWTFSESVTGPPTTPYLYIHSPEPRCGKTRLLELVGALARNPVPAADATPAAIFRLVESIQPTILLDEADAIWTGKAQEDLRGILNSGYKRSGHVIRTQHGADEDGNRGLQTIKLRTFSPKCFAGIDNGSFPSTLLDRSIPIVLKRATVDVPDFFDWEVEEEVESIIAGIDEWVRSHSGVARHIPKRPAGFDGRAWEIAFPLIGLADAMGLGARIRQSLVTLLTREQTRTPGVQLLADIWDAFEKANTDRLFTQELLDHLGPKWNGKLLGERLRPYDVRPTTIRKGNETLKGFYRRYFIDAWERYL